MEVTVVKKVIHALVGLAVVLVVHSLPPLQAQFAPKEEDIIWKLEKQLNDRFLSSHFIDSDRLLFANQGKAEIRSVEDGSIIRTAPSQHSFNFGFSPNPTRTRFVSCNRDNVWLWDVETLSIIQDKFFTS